MDPGIDRQRRAKNLRTGLIVGSIALAFFVGFLVKAFSSR